MTAARIGWLFAWDWDREAMLRLASPTLQCDHAGFDLFAFPDQLRLAGFDIEHFTSRLVRRGRRSGWRGVLSHHEQFGALTAALVAERLGLPGATPESILAAQHKAHARGVLQQVAPEANLRFEVLPEEFDHPVPHGLRYPCFAKPVKAAFSVLARSVADQAELESMLRFGPFERWLMRRLAQPFERVRRARLAQAGSSLRMLLEEPVAADATQHNLDGWVFDGQVHALGVVDVLMYPGTQAFMRWEHPGRLPAHVQQRALDVARRFLAAIGFRHGFFNLEFFFDAAADRLSVIECNPRLASQFSDLYRRVQGRDPHAMAVALTLGEDPRETPVSKPTAGIAASLVYRSFDAGAGPPRMPDAASRAAFHARFPDALLICYPRRGAALARDFRWTGSHRYGIVHLGGRDRAELRDRSQDASALLGWPAPWLDEAAIAPGGSQR